MRPRLLALTAFAAGVAAFAADPAPLSGTWRLVAQHYGGGSFDFASVAEHAFVITFAPDGAGPHGRLAWGTASADWPAWPANDGFAALASSRAAVAPDGAAVADYTVLPAPGDDTFVDVHERCAIDTGSPRLRCTVDVRFRRGDTPAGGFTLTRLFERETAR